MHIASNVVAVELEHARARTPRPRAIVRGRPAEEPHLAEEVARAVARHRARAVGAVAQELDLAAWST